MVVACMYLARRKIVKPINCEYTSILGNTLLFRTLRFVCLFCCFTSQVTSYGHGGMVSSLNHTFFLGKLEQAVYQYFVHILWLVTDNTIS